MNSTILQNNVGLWERKCPLCFNIIQHKSYKSCYICHKSERNCRTCSKQGDFLKSIIKEKIIWKDVDSWCRRCPQCNVIITCNGKNSFRYCVKSEVIKRKCASCSLSGKNNPFYGNHTQSGSSHPRYGKHWNQSFKDNISKKFKGRKNTWWHKAVESSTKNAFKRKHYVFPDGNEYLVQGYEPWTIDMLLTSSISFLDIKLRHNEKPIIPYVWENRIRKYFPDCYIPSSNTIVETKSTWTWKSKLSENIAKISGSLAAGFDVRVIIWGHYHELISDKTYTHT